MPIHVAHAVRENTARREPTCSIELRVMAINDMVGQPARAVSQLPVWEPCNGWPVWKGLLSGERPCERGADGQTEGMRHHRTARRQWSRGWSLGGGVGQDGTDDRGTGTL